MEEQAVQPNKEQNQPNTVMDVQRPTVQPSPTFQQPSANRIPSSDVTPGGRPATMEYTRPRPAESTNAPTNKFSFSPQPDLSFESQNKPKKSKKGFVVAIFVTLFIGLTVGGAAFYYFGVYKQKQQTLQPAPQPAATEQTANESQAIEATPEGVDKTSEEIDKQLNTTNDSQDLSADDVSDASLGL